jgi:hypothetical protein
MDMLTPGLEIRCASIRHNDTNIVLKDNHTQKDYLDFLDRLDFEYDDGYGTQELYGIVWLPDGTWLDRGEYDGSEWWTYRVCPEIPQECLG